MKIDTQEMLALARPEAARVDIYAGIHKAMRAIMCDVLQAVGRTDVTDEAELSDSMLRVKELGQLCRKHLEHENAFVHTALAERCPGACDQAEADHVEHLHHIGALEAAADELPRLPASERDAAALALYRQLALFVADNFQHMQMEEGRHNAALWSAYTDAELLELHGRIVASQPPHEALQVLRWMLPAMTPAERAQVLGGMQTQAPAPVFEAVLDVVKPYLDTTAWGKLTRSLEMAPVAVAALA